MAGGAIQLLQYNMGIIKDVSEVGMTSMQLVTKGSPVGSVFYSTVYIRTYVRTYARTHARTHTRTHARTHTHTRTLLGVSELYHVILFLVLQLFEYMAFST